MQEPITIYSNKKIYLSLFIFCFLFLKHFGVFKMISIIFIILAAYALYRLYKTSPVVIQMTEEGFRKKDSTFVNWDSIIQLNIRKIWWLKYIEYVTKDGTKVLTFLGTGVSAGYIYNIMRKHLVTLSNKSLTEQSSTKIYIGNKYIIINLVKELFWTLLTIILYAIYCTRFFNSLTPCLEHSAKLRMFLCFIGISTLVLFVLIDFICKLSQNIKMWKKEIPMIEMGTKYFSVEEWFVYGIWGVNRWENIANITLEDKSGRNQIIFTGHNGNFAELDFCNTGIRVTDVYETMYKYWQAATHEEN